MSVALSKIGVFGALYFNRKWYPEANYYTQPDWAEVQLARDVMVVGATEEFEMTPKNNGGFRASQISLVDMTIEFGVLHVISNDPTYYYDSVGVFLNSWLQQIPLEMTALDDKIDQSGVSGLRLPTMISRMTKREPMDGGQIWDVTARLHYYPDGAGSPGIYSPTP